MQKQPSRGTLMKRAPKNTNKSTGEHPRQSETPKKLPCSLFKWNSNAGIPPQTNTPSLTPPHPPLTPYPLGKNVAVKHFKVGSSLSFSNFDLPKTIF